MLLPTSSRGTAYRGKGDYDRAIADYNHAIEPRPKDADAYNGRGLVYRRKGDSNRALADYSQAISLDPKNAYGYRNRGRANLYSGALPKALADFNQANALDPKDAYTALWLDIVGRRNNVPSRLAQTSSQLDMTKWPAPVIGLFLGQMTPAAVLAAADDPDPVKKKGQVCEANFYAAELSLSKEAKDEATRLFRLAANDCPPNFIDRNSAISRAQGAWRPAISGVRAAAVAHQPQRRDRQARHPEWCRYRVLQAHRGFPTPLPRVIRLECDRSILLIRTGPGGLSRGFLAMVMRLFAPQFLVVWAFLGSAIAVHFRGKVRLGFWRQFSDDSTIMAPYNVLMYLFSAVPNRPILQVGMISELTLLRDNWQTMREEALVLFAQGQIKAADKYNDWGFNSFFLTGVEAVLSEMVRSAAAVGACQLPEDRRDPEFDPQRQGRDVRKPAARRQTGPAPRSLCRLAALSPRALWCRRPQAIAGSSSTASRIIGARARTSCSTRPICTTPRTPPPTTASSCSATSSGRCEPAP